MVKLTIDIEDELHEVLKKLAKKEDRTLKSYIKVYVSKHLKDERQNLSNLA